MKIAFYWCLGIWLIGGSVVGLTVGRGPQALLVNLFGIPAIILGAILAFRWIWTRSTASPVAIVAPTSTPTAAHGGMIYVHSEIDPQLAVLAENAFQAGQYRTAVLLKDGRQVCELPVANAVAVIKFRDRPERSQPDLLIESVYSADDMSAIELGAMLDRVDSVLDEVVASPQASS